MNQYLGMFQQFGPEKFTQTVCQMAPYFQYRESIDHNARTRICLC